MVDEKYLRPTKLQDVIMNKEKIDLVFNHLDVLHRPVLLVGPPGTGKTFSAYLYARERGLDLVDFNTSSLRRKDDVDDILKSLVMNSVMSSRGRLVLLDEIDGFGKLVKKKKLLVNALKVTKHKVVLTANNPRKVSKSIKDSCSVIKFTHPSPKEIEHFLNKVLAPDIPDETERRSFIETECLPRLVGGDVRNVITLVEKGVSSSRDGLKKSSTRWLFRDDIIRILLQTGKVPVQATKHAPKTILRDLLLNVPSHYFPSDVKERIKRRPDYARLVDDYVEVIERIMVADVTWDVTLLNGLPPPVVTPTTVRLSGTSRSRND